MAYKLRPHHLICLQFYKGSGYGEEFVRNLNKITETWENEPIEVVDGADDVCEKCPFLKENQCAYVGDESIKEDDRFALNLLEVRVGEKIKKESIRRKIPKIIEAWKKETCQDCDWRAVCEISKATD